jgi:hypothetical protein
MIPNRPRVLGSGEGNKGPILPDTAIVQDAPVPPPEGGVQSQEAQHDMETQETPATDGADNVTPPVPPREAELDQVPPRGKADKHQPTTGGFVPGAAQFNRPDGQMKRRVWRRRQMTVDPGVRTDMAADRTVGTRGWDVAIG